VRITITPLGGVQRTLAQIADDIVDYLIPPAGAVSPAATSSTGADGEGSVAAYYADRGDQPGRWLGRGACELGLARDVDGEDFFHVLVGRDPRTGARLVTAQGSAGRRPRLGVGAETRWDGGGGGLYDESDAAVALGLGRDEVGVMLEEGTRFAASRLIGFLAVAATHDSRDGSAPQPEPAGDRYLAPVIDADGDRWVTDHELTRCEDARALGISDDHISAAGAAEDLLTLRDAAASVGVTPRYLRRLARNYEANRGLIDEIVASGQRPRQAYLVAHRDDRDRWVVRRSDLADFVRRRRAPAVRAGYDLTLTTEKSLSVLGLLSDPRTGRQVLDAIQEANDIAIGWLENHAAVARVRGETVQAAGWTVASFAHLTSRALDPFAHWHNVVANTVRLPDGSRRALDARALYRDAKAASALATAHARWTITSTVGVRWRPARHGGWEIAGMSDAVLDAFSQRRTEIDDAVRELEDAIGRGARPDEVERIVLRTRPAKQQARVDELRREWWTRANALGLRDTDLAACIGDRTIVEPDRAWLYAQLAAPDGICQNLSVFDYGDVLAALCNMPVPRPDGSSQPLLTAAEGLEELARGFLASPHVVRLPSASNKQLYTTREILAVQERIADRFAAGLSGFAAVVDRHTVDSTLATHPHLTSEQHHLVRHFCASGHRIDCAIGYPGTGKTTTMAVARQAWESAGYRVVGAAVKGEAARRLLDATGMPTETLSWLLAHKDPHTAPLDARTVLVVDEASTVSDRDLDQIIWLCTQTGAALRLIGDPGQHGAVAAGGMFRVLCDRHPEHTPRLTQTHRVRDPHDRAAAAALRNGDIDEALDHLAAADHLHILDDEHSFYPQVLKHWWDSHLAGLHHPMVDRSNLVRRRLNRLAHRLLQVAGDVESDEIPAAGDRFFSVGDRVIARAPARHLHPPGQPTNYVRNGATGTVIGLHRGKHPDSDTISVAFDEIGTVALPRSYFDEHEISRGRTDVGLDHAYAVTSYAVQGATSRVSTSRIDERSSRAEALVDITRGEEANELYVTRAGRSDPDVEQLPRIPPPAIDKAVARKLRASNGEITAYELIHRDVKQPEVEIDHGDAVGL
jgi:conjugative relaxase-like TrwC/TraI family protein